MHRDPELNESSEKTKHERFSELGTRIMAVPKSEVDKRETEWQKHKGARSRRKKR